LLKGFSYSIEIVPVMNFLPHVALLGLLAASLVSGVSASEPPQAANWISNPSFEVGTQESPVDWVYFNEHETTEGKWGPENARTGKNGVSFTGLGGMSFGRWTTPYRIPLEPGAKYRVSFWYRGSGAHVYVIGQSASMSSAGVLTMDMTKRFKKTISKPGDAKEWTRVTEEFTAPGYASWAQLCLSGSERRTCSFDDVALYRIGLVLVAPGSPLVVASGAKPTVTVYAEELRDAAEGAVQWTVTSPVAKLVSAKKNPDDSTWSLELDATGSGVGDLAISATAPGAKPLSLSLHRFIRTYPGPAGKMFAFAAVTDTHFYRPGTNERNDKFAKVVAALNAFDPLFVISLGDQMEIHSGIRDEENKLIAEAVREQLGLLNGPVFTVSGNHEIDRTYEGVGSRWYYEKYLRLAQHWDFQVGGVLFAGIDVSTPGVSTREHGASFLDEQQAAWLEEILSAHKRGPAVVAAHISPFNEFADTPDRNRLLALLLGAKTRLYLCGHTHFTEDQIVPNVKTTPPWPKPETIRDSAAVTAALQDPAKTGFLTTTTACAFSLGAEKTTGYRYLLVKDGKIAWQDVLPLSLAIKRESGSPDTVKFTVTNGSEKPLAGLPIRAVLPDGRASVTLAGKEIPCEVTPLGNGTQDVWVRVDSPLNSTSEIVFSSKH
jgi:Icc-related predicted phosphoesterase